MQELNIDFHIHSKYSGGTSSDMLLPAIAEGAKGKGLDVMGTGDATHPIWLAHMEKHLTESHGEFTLDGSPTKFLLTSEVEDKNRVHQLIIFPSFDSVHQFISEIESSSVNIASDGRPNVSLSGEELIDLTNDCDALLGPCHAFTPWTSLYKSFDSLGACYGENLRYVKFLELGLSADTDIADRISELKNLTFMTNSDAHSPWPFRLGREFNRVRCKDASFSEVKKAIERKDGRKFTLNVGLNPSEGKYHETACTRCYMKFRPQDAELLKRRCPECGGIIKRGVKERAHQLSDQEVIHPEHRPPYVFIVPLAEIISIARGVSTLQSKKVQSEWTAMVERFGSEIDILLELPFEELSKHDTKIAKMIIDFREGRVSYDAGGGGKYGRPVFGKKVKENFYDSSQKTISQY